MAVGQLPYTRHTFVDRVVDVEVLALPVGVALPPEIEPGAEDPNSFLGALADQEGIAVEAAGLINQGRGGWSQGLVEHGVV